MVAAGALVTPGKRVPSGELWGGRPARRMRTLTDQDTTLFAEIVDGYVRLAANYAG